MKHAGFDSRVQSDSKDPEECNHFLAIITIVISVIITILLKVSPFHRESADLLRESRAECSSPEVDSGGVDVYGDGGFEGGCIWGWISTCGALTLYGQPSSEDICKFTLSFDSKWVPGFRNGHELYTLPPSGTWW